MSIKINKLYSVVAALMLWLTSFAPLAAQSSLDEMLDALSQAEPAEAARLTREIERLWELSGSTTVDMLFRRGREAMEAEDIDAAIEHLTAVTDHAPDFAEGWHARATAFYMKDLYGPALSACCKSLKIGRAHV